MLKKTKMPGIYKRGMRRRLLTLSLAATMFAVIVVPAAATGTRTCSSVLPRYEFAVRINGGSCSLARGLDRYTNSHESTDGAFSFAGHEWLGGVYSRAHGHTYFNYVSPGRVPISVWITDRGAVD